MKVTFLSTKEASAQLGVTRRTVTNAVKDGRLSGYRIGNVVAIVEDAKLQTFKPAPSRWDKEKGR